MSRFVPRAGAEAEIQAILDPFLRELGVRVERKAKVKLREARIKDSGALERSVKAGPVQATVGKSTITVRAVRFNPDGGADVATIIHQGHKTIFPKDKRMVFEHKGGGWVTITPGGLNSRGEKTNQGFVRAVGGVPFLTESLDEAAKEILAETDGKVHFSVIITKPHLVGPAKPALISRRRASGRRRS